MTQNRREQQIFGELLDREPAAREEHVRAAAAGDQELERAVMGLLRAHERAESAASVIKPSPEALLEKPERIGSFRVLEEIGNGGMGVVYLAEQTQPVRRRVAIKLIKHGMDTREIIARFNSEQQALALMSHPNIAQILDAGATEDGRPYFVMEHVSGLPITEYCDINKLGIDARLALLVEVGKAVRHAHSRGVVHRDLKPSNILVAEEDGEPRPKIIDFGIAKATNQRLTDLTVYTEYGQLIGTPDYMSPEQATGGGLDIDERTDVYALGVVAYELLVGVRPHDFQGSDHDPAEIRRVLTEESPEAPSQRAARLVELLPAVALQRGLSPRRLARALCGELDWIVLRALEKNPADRYATIAEFCQDIEHRAEGEPLNAGPPGLRYRLGKFVQRRRAALATVSAALVALFGLATLGVSGTVSPAAAGGARRLELVTVPDSFTPRIAPDGSAIAYEKGDSIWVRPFDGRPDFEIEAAGAARYPFWSPDGASLGYLANDKLWRVSSAGGTSLLVATLDGFGGAAWLDDDSIVYSATAGLTRVSASGGPPEIVVKLPDGVQVYADPSSLPGGGFVYLEPGGRRLWAWRDGKARVVADFDYSVRWPRYSSTGHLVFSREQDGKAFASELWALPFSAQRLEATGDAFQLVPLGGQPSVTREGAVVFQRVVDEMRQLSWVTVSGEPGNLRVHAEPAGPPQQGIMWPSLSHSGSLAAVSALEDGRRKIWIHDLVNQRRSPLAADTEGVERYPEWFPDDQRVAYLADADGDRTVRIRNASGSGAATVIDRGVTVSVSPDGASLLYGQWPTSPRATSTDLRTASLVAGGRPQVFREALGAEGAATFSPDGAFVVFVWSRPGQGSGGFVTTYPRSDMLWQFAPGGAVRRPRFSPDGEAIYYWSQEDFYRVGVTWTENGPRFDSPVLQFSAADGLVIPGDYDIAADGRFLMIQRTPNQTLDAGKTWIMLENWIEGVGR